MLSAIEQFRDNILRVRDLGALVKALGAITTPVIDTSDILRAQYVLAVSALDHYVHEVTRLGMLATFDGNRQASPAYLRFRVPLGCLGAGQVLTRSNVEAEIRNQHSFAAFQHPDRIADAIRLICEVKLWERVAQRIGSEADKTKDRLKLIVDRRNKIAHEADLDPTYPKARWPISSADVDGVVDFLVTIVEAIHTEVA